MVKVSVFYPNSAGCKFDMVKPGLAVSIRYARASATSAVVLPAVMQPGSLPELGSDSYTTMSLAVHAKAGKADPHEAERRRGQQRADADCGCHRLQHQREQRTEQLAREDEQQARNH